MQLPTGTVTFLFTDIEGSTRLWETAPDAMSAALARHDAVLRNAIEANGGAVFKTVGDAFCAAFATAPDAVAAALAAQLALLRAGDEVQENPSPVRLGSGSPVQAVRQPLQLRARMALHTGAPEVREHDYFGPPLNRVARLLALAHGGQVLVSEAASLLVKSALPAGAFLDDLGLHPLKDLTQPERVWQLRHPELPSEFPPLRPLQDAVYNLPPRETPFVGRERELARWQDLLRTPERRLFTITGLGGMGKTRVAMCLAELCLHQFPDGVWWCAQEEARTSADLVNLLADQLSLSLSPAQPVLEQVVRFLEPRDALIVLDNLEQVEGASGIVRSLLAGAPSIRILATSRRALELRGETVLELGPLDAVDAETLFQDRAQACQPDFAFSDENRADVVDLCRRLEGLPLAIELAAARCVGMTARQMIARLNERFRLLQSRSPDLSPRQRALRGTLDWSYNMLAEEEQTVLGQLAVFAGGFTVEDAEAVCDAFDVFESVMELRKHSFFRTETQAASQELRFLMPDTVREYAREKLVATGPGSHELFDRHAHYYLEYTRRRLNLIRTAAEAGALRDLELNGANLRVATNWALAAGDLRLHSELALANGILSQRRGFLQQACEAIEAGLASVHSLADPLPLLLAQLLRERAGLHLDYEEYEPALRAATEALTIYSEAGDTAGEADVENLLGQVKMRTREFAPAREHFARALARYERSGSKVGQANVRNNLGLLERHAAAAEPDQQAVHWQEAEKHLLAALELRQALHDSRGIAETLNNLGVLAYARSHWQQARDFYRRALDQEQNTGHAMGIGRELFNLGEVTTELGAHDQAVLLLAAAEAQLAELGFPQVSYVRDKLTAAADAAGMAGVELDALRTYMRNLSTVDRIGEALRAQSNRPSVAILDS